MLLENGIVRVGAEIEVAEFRGTTTMQTVAQRLLDLGHMEGTIGDWARYHDYNCRCAKCVRVTKGNLLQPLLVSMQYDASLPETGAEFIISPALLLNGLEEMRVIYETITDQAVWTMEPANRRGGQTSPSIHLHVSALNPEVTEQEVLRRFETNGEMPNQMFRNDVLHALSLYAPELILLADIEEFRRGLHFRQPWRFTPGRRGHHGFIDVRQAHPRELIHIEWRLFEAAYNNWEYFEGAAYLSAALTRALLKPATFEVLMAEGYKHALDPLAVENAIANDDTEAILHIANPNRLEILETVIRDELEDDPYGAAQLATMFGRSYDRV